MPNTYIKDSEDWELLQRPWVKDGGSWKPVKKIWIKTDQIVTNTVVPGGEILSTVAGADSGWFVQQYNEWGTFMNTYAIDTNGSLNSAKTFNATVNFPADGDYEFRFQIDNFGLLSLDYENILVIPSSSGYAFNQNIDTFGYSLIDTTNNIGVITTRYVTAGTHNISITMADSGVIAGLACQILSVNTPLPSTEIWNTRQAISDPTQYAYSPIVSNSVSEKKSVWKQVFGNTGRQLFKNGLTKYAIAGNYFYTVPNDITSLTVKVVGGGGGGGRFHNGCGGTGLHPGGDGGGGYINTGTLTVTPGQIVPLTVGAGGAGGDGAIGAYPIGNGFTGQSSSILGISANGGGGGTGNTSKTRPNGVEGGGLNGGAGGKHRDSDPLGKKGRDGEILIYTSKTTSFQVPPGVYNIKVGPYGLGGIGLKVVPKDIISVFVGEMGEGASFGSITIPANFFRRDVIYHKGYVDRYLRQTINIATPTGESYTSAPYLGNVYPTAGRDDAVTIASQAAKKGINITTDLENSWGDLAQEITINPLQNDGTLPGKITVYLEQYAGRGTVTIEQQPSAANGYKVKILVDDNGPGAADLYEYSLTVDVEPYVSISY